MDPLIIVQARMGSQRFPGKVLTEVGTVPLIEIMLGRLRGLNSVQLVVATSTLPSDDAIVQYCERSGVDVFRGSERDVLSRFADAVDAYGASVLARLSGDCPLADPAVVAEAFEEHAASGAMYTSNTLVRTFPLGLDVEVMDAKVLLEADAEARDPVEREHVTPFIYRRPERFPLRAFRTADAAPDERWTVDRPEDLLVIQDALTRVADWRSAGWQEILAAVGRRADPTQVRMHLSPAGPGDEDVLLEWRNDPVTVKFSASGKPVDPDAHHEWFSSVLTCPRTRIWIGRWNEIPVGQVRVDVTSSVGAVDIAIGPSLRGRGYGKELLAGLLQALRLDYQVQRLEAVIHLDNLPSLRAFEANGFVRTSKPNGEFATLSRERS